MSVFISALVALWDGFDPETKRDTSHHRTPTEDEDGASRIRMGNGKEDRERRGTIDQQTKWSAYDWTKGDRPEHQNKVAARDENDRGC